MKEIMVELERNLQKSRVAETGEHGDVGANERSRIMPRRLREVTTFFEKNNSRLIEIQELIYVFWGGHASPNTVHKTISRLRRAIGDDPRNPRWIKTLYGFGYIYEPPKSNNLQKISDSEIYLKLGGG